MDQDRRGFLKSGAAAAFATAFFTPPGANSKVNIAFIGDAATLSGNPGFAARTSGVHVAADSNDFREILADKSIHAVCIATPDDSHARIAIEACKASKDVWIEPVASMSAEVGARLVEAARKYQRIVQAGTVHRSSGVLRNAREIVKSGKLGDVSFCRAFHPNADWDIHLMDAVQFIFDDATPLSVTAHNLKTPAATLATYRYPSFIVSHESRTSDSNGGIVLHGTKATLRVNLDYNPNMSMAHWANFVECIDIRQRPASDIETYVRSAATSSLAKLACRHSSAVAWDDKAFTWKLEA